MVFIAIRLCCSGSGVVFSCRFLNEAAMFLGGLSRLGLGK